MFKKIVSVIFERKLSIKNLDFLKEFSKLNSGTIYFISLVDKRIIDQISAETGRRKKIIEEEKVKKRFEELYEIEEYFKNEEIKIYLNVFTFSGTEELNSILNSIGPNIVIFNEPNEYELKEILKIKNNFPIMILNKK